jgi:hypothetical protein
MILFGDLFGILFDTKSGLKFIIGDQPPRFAPENLVSLPNVTVGISALGCDLIERNFKTSILHHVIPLKPSI